MLVEGGVGSKGRLLGGDEVEEGASDGGKGGGGDDSRCHRGKVGASLGQRQQQRNAMDQRGEE